MTDQISPDRMPFLLALFKADCEALERVYAFRHTVDCRSRMATFYREWQENLEAIRFELLAAGDRADWVLFRNLLKRELRLLDEDARRYEESSSLLQYARALLPLEAERRNLSDIDAQAAALALDGAVRQIQLGRQELETALAEGRDRPRPSVACRAAAITEAWQKYLQGWYSHYSGFDPLFTWWCEKPYQALDRALGRYVRFLRRKVAGAEDPDTIVGDPIGREALLESLADNMIPYSPEELMEIARRERDWCLSEGEKAAKEMGCAGWREAVERVKELHVEPGRQTALVRELANEAIRYVTDNDLVTVPPLAAETWRMEMMPPEKQKINPFFLGGEVIQVSYPTNAMDHDFKRMSLRGNNRHFSRATVQHELIPGHHLQFYSVERFHPYRQLFETPFWIEGWTIHWEFLLWEKGFPQSAEDRIGMLFWRLHRCARVIFSLGFHLGEMTPEQCVETLVDEVGHERENALGEVRRSFGGDYDPLYQCGYLIGGLQVHALYREMAGSGQMTDRDFHDRFLQENMMPIAVLRALMTHDGFTPDFAGDWRFYDLNS